MKELTTKIDFPEIALGFEDKLYKAIADIMDPSVKSDGAPACLNFDIECRLAVRLIRKAVKWCSKNITNSPYRSDHWGMLRLCRNFIRIGGDKNYPFEPTIRLDDERWLYAFATVAAERLSHKQKEVQFRPGLTPKTKEMCISLMERWALNNPKEFYWAYALFGMGECEDWHDAKEYSFNAWLMQVFWPSAIHAYTKYIINNKIKHAWN